MIVALRSIPNLNGYPVAAGQVLDQIWPTLRERTRRVLRSERWVEDVPEGGERTKSLRADPVQTPGPPGGWTFSERAAQQQVVAVQEEVYQDDTQVVEDASVSYEAVVEPRKRGRPKGSRNKPKPAAPA